MLCRSLIGLGRAHHPDIALETLCKSGRAQIVAAHVRGEQNRAARGRQLLEKFFAFHFVGELGLSQLVIGRVGNRPGKVVERQPGARLVQKWIRAGQHHFQVAQN